MSVVDEPRTDQKAGYSANCRAGRHATCCLTGARCTCTCHGPRGQKPPAPSAPHPTPTITTPPPLAVVPAPTIEEDVVPPDAPKPFPCLVDGCTRSFDTLHARQVHAARGHKPPKAQTPPQPKAPKAPTIRSESGDDASPFLLTVLRPGDDELVAIEFEDLDEMQRTVEILAELGLDAGTYEKRA